ncbi:MAG: DUF6067 family protein, partial [Planctomycetota bacterium]|nr:DUF6067 family protein [Planctomycetota bacterium]
IDGTIQDAEWAKASLFPSLISRDPLAGDGMPPPERTWVWMAYTDDALYWAFRQDLPPQELPVKASVTTGRDNAEARDNTVNILFTTDPRRREQFNISGNPNGILYDRRFDNGQGKYWNPAIEYKAKPTPTGWDGEMKIPFKVLDLKVAPATGSIWNCYFYSAWRKAGTRLFSFPYLGWRQRVTGKIVFGGEAPGVRFEDDGAIRFAGKNAGSVNLSSKLLFRAKSPGSSFYFSSVASAIEVSKGEGATFQSYDDIIDGELKTFGPAEDVKAIGEYLHRFDATLGKMTLASGVHSFHVSPPLGVVVTPYFLKAKRLGIVALSGLNDAVRLNLSVEPGNRKTRTTFIARRAEAFFSTDGWPAGEYKLTAEAVDGRGKVIARAVSSFSKPAPPNWWTTEPGKEPLIPPPWIPLKASKEKVEMLDRVYSFDDDALPSQIVTRGKAILAGPVRLEASTPWKEKKLELTESRPDAVLYNSWLKNDETTIQIRNSIEFDGFMRIDFRMQGPGTIDKLDLV